MVGIFLILSKIAKVLRNELFIGKLLSRISTFGTIKLK